MPTINAAGLSLIKEFEGCSLTAYPDPGTGSEPYTIGYGHTGGVQPDETITQAEADALLASDLERFEAGVNAMVDRDLTSNQFSALVSLAYNIGLGALQGSTLLRLLNGGNIAGAAEQFDAWVDGADGPMPGLVQRRAAEKALFLTP